MYPQKLLIPIYKNILKASHGRGSHTLAKLDAIVFRYEREVFIDEEVSIYLPANPHFFGYLLKTHESHIKNLMSKLLNKGDVVVDIGANIGYFTAWAAAFVGTTGKVFSMEPEKNNLKILSKNVDSLRYKGFGCYWFELAASNQNGTATLSIHRHSTYHSIEDDYHILDKVEGIQKINTIKLDDWAINNQVEHISLLKVDTEGHETNVLEGATRLYEQRRIDYTILELRSQHIYEYVRNFCNEFNLVLSIWNGDQWQSDSLDEITPKLEGVISVYRLFDTV
jgi:FkbM family methyltransferase